MQKFDSSSDEEDGSPDSASVVGAVFKGRENSLLPATPDIESTRTKPGGRRTPPVINVEEMNDPEEEMFPVPTSPGFANFEQDFPPVMSFDQPVTNRKDFQTFDVAELAPTPSSPMAQRVMVDEFDPFASVQPVPEPASNPFDPFAPAF